MRRGSRSWAYFLTLWPAIKQLLDEDGYSLRAIHRAMNAEAAWSGSFTVFHRHAVRARQERGDASLQVTEDTPATEQALPSSTPTAHSASAPQPTNHQLPPGFAVHPSAMEGPPVLKRKKRS